MPLTDEYLRGEVARLAALADPCRKHLELASLVGALFRERGLETVVVGGSAVEFYTEGGYVSGDLDLCILDAPRPAPRLVADLMAQLGAGGGRVRSFEVAGAWVDVLGQLEAHARTALVTVAAPNGTVTVARPEDVLVERVFVSIYPQANPTATRAADTLLAAALERRIPFDWAEAARVAALPAYDIAAAWEEARARVARLLTASAPATGPAGPPPFRLSTPTGERSAPPTGQTGFRSR